MSTLKFHEIIRPPISQSFYEETLNFWLRREEGHVGPSMYQHHAGRQGQKSMSGVSTWADHEKNGTLPQKGKQLFLETIHHVVDELPRRMPVVEFGPGSMEDAQTIINATQTRTYIPVDCSLENLRQASRLVSFTKDCMVKPAIVNFFSKDNCALIDEPALGVFLGLTIGNIPGPIPSTEPRDGLVQTLSNLLRAMPQGGALLVSVDVCQDGATNVARYNEPWHRIFSVNHLYRMEAELPMDGFNPDGFTYEPVWYEHCGLLAHTLRATEEQTFYMGKNREERIDIKQNDVFHCNNSYKFRPDFFEDCAEEAGLDVIKIWKGDSSIWMYLLDVPPQQKRSGFCAPLMLQNMQTSLSLGTSYKLAKLQERARLYG